MINIILYLKFITFFYIFLIIISTVLSSFVDYVDDDVLILTIKCNRKTSNTITTLCSAVNIKKQIILKKSNFIEKQKDDFSKITPTQQEKQFSSTNKKAIENKRK